jgi:transposase, IS5 family
MRSFVGIDLGREPVPDETTVCRSRHLLEAHEIGGIRLPSLSARAGHSSKLPALKL